MSILNKKAFNEKSPEIEMPEELIHSSIKNNLNWLKNKETLSSLKNNLKQKHNRVE